MIHPRIASIAREEDVKHVARVMHRLQQPERRQRRWPMNAAMAAGVALLVFVGMAWVTHGAMVDIASSHRLPERMVVSR